MMSSGGAQNMRPASAPGEDAPSAGSADRNEVNIIVVCLLTWKTCCMSLLTERVLYFLMSLCCFLSLMGVAYSESPKINRFLYDVSESSSCKFGLHPKNCQGRHGCSELHADLGHCRYGCMLCVVLMCTCACIKVCVCVDSLLLTPSPKKNRL